VAKGRQAIGDELVEILLLPDVALAGDHPPVEDFNLVLELCEVSCVGGRVATARQRRNGRRHVDGEDVRTLGRQAEHMGSSLAMRGAGHQSYLAVEASHDCSDLTSSAGLL